MTRQAGGLYRGTRRQAGGLYRRRTRRQKGGLLPLLSIPALLAAGKAATVAGGLGLAGALGSHLGNKIATRMSGGGKRRKRRKNQKKQGQHLNYVGIVKQR